MSRKITIGLPVYNGGNFLKERIKNILSQNYDDFELIISNNASTDNTDDICEQFVNKDNRIKYFVQEKNEGGLWNFEFTLNASNTPYFVWAGVDDIWDNDFLKENIYFLESTQNFVGSIGQVEKFGMLNQRELSSNKKIKNIIKQFRWSRYGAVEAAGNYETKTRTYLQNNSAQAIYGIFRTDVLKKAIINKSFLAMDLAIILNILKYGDFHVIQKKLIRFNMGGFSSNGINSSTKKLNHSMIGRIFPYYPFTKWCFINIGKKIFFKNFFHFVKLNVTGILAIIYDLLLSKK
jgi:glycosyltransferase involved in cell wall biosynthesis